MDDNQSHSPAPSHPLRWLPEFAALSHKRLRSQGRLFGAAILVGIVAGLGAVLFAVACQVVLYVALEVGAGYRPVAPAGEARLRSIETLEKESTRTFQPWLLLFIPAVGGLLSGLIVFRFAPEAEGHGTDAVIDAYHNRQGQIRPRVPLVKILASAITIGSGGSGGREGPIAQIGAGFGSLLARMLKMRPAERRVLLAAGMGAGVAAIFRAPLAGALFAAEVLYWSAEFEAEVIIPAGIASAVAYCTFGIFFGWHPLFVTPTVRFDNAWHLAPYTLLAVSMSILAMLYTRTFYGITHLFRRLKISPYFRPALGAFLSAVVGLLLYFSLGEQLQVLSVLSFGYGILQESLTNEAGLSALVLMAIAFGKILTTSLTIGSGGSGGVFGPSMVIGGCGGGALGLFLHQIWPALIPHPASYVIVGMAGFFAAAAKTPFSTLVIVSEMTGDYNLLLPALWVCTLSFLLSDEQSLYRSQVESRSRSPAHQGSYVREVLAGLIVRPFLTQQAAPPWLHPNDSLATVIDRLSESTYPVLPVVDGEKRLLGVVILEEIHVASQSPHMQPWVLAADLLRDNIQPLQPDDRLDVAQELFVENDLLALPVVDNLKDRHVLGVVKRSDIAKTYLRHVHGARQNSSGSS
jgi:CIC family chloride channel protein